MRGRVILLSALVAGALCWGEQAIAADRLQRCVAQKANAVATAAACHGKQAARATLGRASSSSACTAKLAAALARAEAGAGGTCTGVVGADRIDRVLSENIGEAIDAAVGTVRYIDRGDGTIFDTTTGLTWEQKDQPATCVTRPPPRVGSYATDHCRFDVYYWQSRGGGLDSVGQWLGVINGSGEDLGLGGFEDWRLPTLAELRTIIPECDPEKGCASSPLPVVFGLDDSAAYWTGSALVSREPGFPTEVGAAYALDPTRGAVVLSTNETAAVIAVRRGVSPATAP